MQLRPGLPLLLLLASAQNVHCDEPGSAVQPELKLHMNPETIGRYVSDHWGTTKANASNESIESQTALVVVTPGQ